MTLTRVLSQKGVFIVFFLNQKQWLAVIEINEKHLCRSVRSVVVSRLFSG